MKKMNTKIFQGNNFINHFMQPNKNKFTANKIFFGFKKKTV